MFPVVKEECGICAADVPGRNAIKHVYRMMLSIQNRGQNGCGFSRYKQEDRGQVLDTHKGLGLVDETFRAYDMKYFRQLLDDYKGSKGIGHTRYSTSGPVTKAHIQPFERHHGKRHKWFSFCYNGHVTNRMELEADIREQGYYLSHDTDTEILMHFISKFVEDEEKEVKQGNLVPVFEHFNGLVDGAYSLAFLNGKGDLTVVRDPMGFKPLTVTKNTFGAYAASESVALDVFNIKELEPVPPGYMALMKDGDYELVKFAESPRKALCHFEFIYFSHVASMIDNAYVYTARKKLGVNLARAEPTTPNGSSLVIPVPNTSRPVAVSFAEELGIPYEEGLIATNKGRTFIADKSGGEIQNKVRMKFNVIRTILKDRVVYVVDDSIVRMNTMKHIVRLLKQDGGAKEVHVRIGEPPIVSPCFYGIDMSCHEELAAAPYSEDREDPGQWSRVLEKLAFEIGADSLNYNTIDGLVDAIGLPRKDLCLACITGEYPTKHGQREGDCSYQRFCEGTRTKKRVFL